MLSFAIKPKPKHGDVRNELNTIKKICANHKALCQSFVQWKDDIDENEAQLKILNEAAMSLRERHKNITAQLSRKPVDIKVVTQLENEIRKVESQVDMWIRELAEINEARTKLEVQFVRLRSKLRLSTVNIEVANLDIDRIELNYRQMWNDFLYNNTSNGTNRMSSTTSNATTTTTTNNNNNNNNNKLPS